MPKARQDLESLRQLIESMEGQLTGYRISINARGALVSRGLESTMCPAKGPQ